MLWDDTFNSGAPNDIRFAPDNSQWTVATGGAKAAGGAKTVTPDPWTAPASGGDLSPLGGVSGGGTNSLVIVGIIGASLIAAVFLLRKGRR